MRFHRAGAGVLLVAAAGAFAAVSPPPKLTLVRVVCYSAPLGPPLPVLVAEAQGGFARHGVAVHIQAVPNSTELRQILASGHADVAHGAVDNADRKSVV